jgi:D-alanine-D-alanine ligase
MGSSVGISRVGETAGLAKAIETALQYDERVLIEVEAKGRELETAVLGGDIVEAAEVGEIIKPSGFYDYDTKYKTGAGLGIPADIPTEVREEIRSLAVRAFHTVGGSGFARVDFFYEESVGRVYVNELNTLPGCTKFSMFPSLWAAQGVAYTELIERIIDLGYERHFVKNHR